jgi:hypothetical protein
MVNQIFINYSETISNCFRAQTGVGCKKRRVEGSHETPKKSGRTRKACVRRGIVVRTHGPTILGRSAAGAGLELRYYGATWCAPCHRVEPMIDRWAAGHTDLRIVKLD